MGCIVLMMPRQEDAIRLKDIIRHSGICEDVVISRRGSETLEIVASRDVSVVVCTKKVADMGYEQLSSYLPVSVTVLLLTQDAALTPLCSNVVKLLMPFKANDFAGSIRMLLPTTYVARPKKKKPTRSPEEQKIIDDAKAILMDQNDMTEPEAFRYIQKVSMDTSRSMVESAQMILLLNGR